MRGEVAPFPVRQLDAVLLVTPHESTIFESFTVASAGKTAASKRSGSIVVDIGDGVAQLEAAIKFRESV